MSRHLTHAQSIHDRTHLIDPMHACLNVDEIVRLIAQELVASSGSPGSAVSLACCCKSFEDPVLDMLWAKQYYLPPLLKSLPGDVWKEGGYSVSASTTCLFSLSLIIRFDSPSRDSHRRRSGLVSGSTLEGCKSSDISSIKTPCPRKHSRSCNSAP